MASHPPDYSEYYIRRPTQADYEAYRQRRVPALARPLKVGDLVAWTGANLNPEALPPLNYPGHDLAERSPHPPRPLLASLVDSSSSSQGGLGRSLRLLEPLQEGVNEWAQVWKCAVVPDRQAPDEKEESVVLKLRQQSLFPLPEPIASNPDCHSWNWYPASHLIRNEAFAYSQMQAYQGRDLPLCYGFHRFDLPCGESAIGVVLEDLTNQSIPLDDFFKDEKESAVSSVEEVKPFMYSAFQSQHRLQNCGVLDMPAGLHHVLYLKSSALHDPLVVFVGFGFVFNQQDGEETLVTAAQLAREKGFQQSVAQDWHAPGQHRLRSAFEDIFEELHDVHFGGWLAENYVDFPQGPLPPRPLRELE
ncbi:hypothetical protein JCM8547_008238 [Rhodosporidiobolus lusitaniae]